MRKSQREIFAAALECADVTARQQLLDQECGEDTLLRAAVETLLDEHSQIGDFLENPALGGQRQTTTENLIGKKFGSFTLTKLIGEGGGGSVYLAEQVLPVKRKVALKILKLGLDTQSVIARFEAERQTLARMEHPNIASVFDAGSTDEGRPYFVMEYVAGEPLTEYCESRNLTLEERLTIFIRVCRAIEHAHQKGVIHRDLKPSNILVRDQEGQAIPKIIDFGVAKAINPQEDDLRGLTIQDTLVGTPAYMSPEQASRGPSDIDTRADVYSLGVVLYELLTGVTPLTASTEGQSGRPEVLKILREIDPPRPTTYFRTHQGKEKKGDPGEKHLPLLSGLHEDLDWIVMKCLEKDRSRRFGSSSDLARDLELFLKGSPITARPPSYRYRLGKFIRRNSLVVVSASLLVITLIVAMILIVLFGLQARKAEQTETELREVAETDREQALESARIARRHQYVANINLAHQALLDDNLAKALVLLEPWETVPQSEEDLRGFEWWYLMNRATGDEHVSLPRFGDAIDALAFSPDLSRLAVATRGRVRLWSTSRNRFVNTFPRDAKTLEFTSDGRRLILGGQEGVSVFDIRTNDLVWELNGENLNFALSPDEKYLATSDREGSTLWNTTGWRRAQFIPDASGSLSFSPKGDVIAVQSREKVVLWPLDNQSRPLVLEEAPGRLALSSPLGFSRDGNFIVIARNESMGEAGYSLALWDTKTGKEVAMLPTRVEGNFHSGVISDLSFSGEGDVVATSSWDHTVRLWDFREGRLIRSFLGHRGEVWSVALSPRGNFIASGSKSGEVKIWPTRSSSESDFIKGRWSPLGFSPDSRSLAACSENGMISTFDLASGDLIESRPLLPLGTARLQSDLVSADREAQRVAIHQGRGKIAVFDRKSGKQIQVVENGPGRISQIKLSPEGDSLVVIGQGEKMTWWDLEKLSEPIAMARANRVLFSNDGSTLMSTSERGKTIIWNSRTKAETGRLDLKLNSFGSRLALSPDGDILANTHGFRDHENAISLWDTRELKKTGVLQGHKQGIWGLTFSPDGKTIASVGGGGVLRLWNISTKGELLAIRDFATPMTDLAFSPDGRSLIANSPAFQTSPEIRIIRSNR